jgi:hypothetical protein
MKLNILKQVICPHISFELKVYDFAETWLSGTLDGLVHAQIRRWLELPVSTCVEEIATLPKKMCGLGIPSLLAYARNLRLTVRAGLKNSASHDVRQLWTETSVRNISIDSALISSASLPTAKKVIKLQTLNAAVQHIRTLQLQGASITSVIENIKSSTISTWSKCVQSLPAPLFNFTRKGLQQQLATLSNLCRWGKAHEPTCPLCKQVQTNKHVLSNCTAPCALQRYKLRHDAILFILCNWLKTVMIPDAQLYADISGFAPLENLFSSLRPDIAVVLKDAVYLCELTVCHETNLCKSRDYKRHKYAAIRLNLNDVHNHYAVKLYTVELSVLGFLSDCTDFIKSVSTTPLPQSVCMNLMRNVIGNSFNIYLNRNVEN